LHAIDRRSRTTLTGAALTLAITLAPAGSALAQGNPEDFYRAEIVILQRLVDPAAVEENMSGKQVEPAIESSRALWVEDASGSRSSDLKLTGVNELHLGRAAGRLENSGNYRVLAAAGWYQSFPPNYDGAPLRVAVGDWLTGARQKAVEGHIDIDRKRYLHVGVHLNHWQQGTAPQDEFELAADGDASAPDTTPEETNQALQPSADATQGSIAGGIQPAVAAPTPVELVTWIRETRRMRSEEIHFIDSPTIGVLVFFKKM